MGYMALSEEVQVVPEHILEMAKALVRIVDGEIEVLTDPQIRRCPLRKEIYGCDEESRTTVEDALRGHMRDLGMYGPGRVLELHEKPVSFGASEVMFDALSEGLLDAAVVVCEGAGTVVVSKPEVLQALGAHMVGLVRTEPIAEIQQGLRERDCILLDDVCTIDQVLGFEVAIDAGFEKVAVTVAGRRASDAMAIRKIGERSGKEPAIFAVHTTGISDEEAQSLAESCDLVWSCASRSAREVVGKKSKMQIGISIPVFALTDLGKRLLLNRALHFDGGLVISRADLPLAPAGKQPEPLL
jgi:putative methanogenesis marker protein 8